MSMNAKAFLFAFSFGASARDLQRENCVLLAECFLGVGKEARARACTIK